MELFILILIFIRILVFRLIFYNYTVLYYYVCICMSNYAFTYMYVSKYTYNSKYKYKYKEPYKKSGRNTDSSSILTAYFQMSSISNNASESLKSCPALLKSKANCSFSLCFCKVIALFSRFLSRSFSEI